MSTHQSEILLDRMQAVIEQSHRLQLEMLEMWRAVLMEAPAGESGPGDDSKPALDFAVSGLDLPDKPTFTIEEVGRILGVGRGTAYRAVQLGQIPSLRLGSRLLIPRAALVRMLRSGMGH